MVEGNLTFFSETGTEGGFWAFYDPSDDTYAPPSYGVYVTEKVYRPGDRDQRGEVVGTWHVDGRAGSDPLTQDPDYVLSTLFCGQKAGDREADARLAARWGFEITYGTHEDSLPDEPAYLDMSAGPPRTTPERPYGTSSDSRMVARVRWEDGTTSMHGTRELWTQQGSYSGLRILADGDHLQVRDPETDEVVYDGIIHLHEQPLFTTSAGGMWIHALQEGFTEDESRERWGRMFHGRYPARYTPAREVA